LREAAEFTICQPKLTPLYFATIGRPPEAREPASPESAAPELITARAPGALLNRSGVAQVGRSGDAATLNKDNAQACRSLSS